MEDFSIYTGVKRPLHVVDYVVFSMLFVSSAAIGFYHAYKDRHNTNADNFTQGGRHMHPVPVALSLCATFMSALTMLGNPAEIYMYGTMFYWIILAMFLCTIISAHIFIPIFYRMKNVSCFSYIQLRFGTFVRVISSIIFLLSTLSYMGFVLYAPSLAFEAVTGLNLWGTMIGVSAVCTMYTALGGMKTVIWTDSLQIFIMFAGVILVLIFGSQETGGFANAWEIAKANNRIDFFNISPDPRTRHSVWSVGIGGGMFWCYLYGVNQSQVQRACSLPTLRKSQIAVWLSFPILVGIITLTCMSGIVMYAFYKDCDPVKFGLVDKPDQMLPLLVLDILGTMPGLSGLFLACIFSGSLSSISSALNAMSCVLTEDFIKAFCWKSLSGRWEVVMSKLMVVLMGVAQFFMAAGISQASGLVLQLSYTLFSTTGGPLLALFIAGILFPCTNKYGATVGFICSLIFMNWLGISAIVLQPTPFESTLPVSTEGCNWNVSSIARPITNATVVNTTADEPAVYDLYRVSYQWYTAMSVIISLPITLLVSAVTGATDAGTLDPDLTYPLLYNLLPCLPEKWRRRLKCGVRYESDVTSDSGGIKMTGYDNVTYTNAYIN